MHASNVYMQAPNMNMHTIPCEYYTFTDAHTHTRRPTQMYTIYWHTGTRTRTHTFTHAHMHINAHVYTETLCKGTNMHYTRTCIHTHCH